MPYLLFVFYVLQTIRIIIRNDPKGDHGRSKHFPSTLQYSTFSWKID